MSQSLDKAVTARFSREDYLQLQREAENRGCTIADAIRSAWRQYQQEQQLQQLLIRLEQRQRKVFFEMLCCVIDLTTDERKLAIQKLKENGVKF